jgi:hypothetical protein
MKNFSQYISADFNKDLDVFSVSFDFQDDKGFQKIASFDFDILYRENKTTRSLYLWRYKMHALKEEINFIYENSSDEAELLNGMEKAIKNIAVYGDNLFKNSIII